MMACEGEGCMMKRIGLVVVLALAACGSRTPLEQGAAEAPTVVPSQPQPSTESTTKPIDVPSTDSSSVAVPEDNPAAVTGYTIGDKVDPAQTGLPPWLDASGLPIAEKYPTWIAVSDQASIVVGYVKTDLKHQSLPPDMQASTPDPELVVWDQSGTHAVGCLTGDGVIFKQEAELKYRNGRIDCG
jgi:predicted small lipoprotein YifL